MGAFEPVEPADLPKEELLSVLGMQEASGSGEGLGRLARGLAARFQQSEEERGHAEWPESHETKGEGEDLVIAPAGAFDREVGKQEFARLVRCVVVSDRKAG